MTNWTLSDIPSQYGRTAIVTGTSGLGLEDAVALASAGARVIVAGRNREKGISAITRIRNIVPNAEVSFEVLDLASLDSIVAFAERLQSSLTSIELLINNAGVMTPPRREVTSDGFELQFGTNYLGHFALTALLLPLLCKGKKSRVVTLSSIAARDAAIHFDNLQSEITYKPMIAYSQSKLACLMFALELQRRSNAAGWGIQSIASHPGVARTDLLVNGAGVWSAAGMARRFLWFLFQPVDQGALPTLFAATAAQAEGGAYYGPDKFKETRGYPTLAKIPSQALNLEQSRRLWTEAEKLTGVKFLLREKWIANAKAKSE